MKPIRPGLAVMVLLAAACGDAGSGSGTAAEDTAAAPAAAGADISTDTLFTAGAEDEALPSVRIYHTLTDFEWYARGEPLRHDGQSYMPGGVPLAAGSSVMERVGEYQGVEYYTRTDQPGPLLYVPVYRGYWQPFSAVSGPQSGS